MQPESGQHSGALVIPFPERGHMESRDHRFLARTSCLIDELVIEAERDEAALLRLHTAIDLRRPRLYRLLAAIPHAALALRALDLVSDSHRGPQVDQADAARHRLPPLVRPRCPPDPSAQTSGAGSACPCSWTGSEMSVG
jgi:hypothetical protein